MEKIDLPLFYQLGTNLNQITKPFGTDLSRRVAYVLDAVVVRENILILQKSFPSLKVCQQLGAQLVAAINTIWEWFDRARTLHKELKQPDQLVDSYFYAVIEKAKKFEIVLLEELKTLVVYHVTQKGIYSTQDLIASADKSLLPVVLEKLEDKVKNEIRESGQSTNQRGRKSSKRNRKSYEGS